jgi:hypothetical protein
MQENSRGGEGGFGAQAREVRRLRVGNWKLELAIKVTYIHVEANSRITTSLSRLRPAWFLPPLEALISGQAEDAYPSLDSTKVPLCQSPALEDEHKSSSQITSGAHHNLQLSA